MSLANIKSQMSTALKTIAGIDTDHVFTDEPNTTPTQEHCPCIVLALPRISPSVPHNGMVQVIYHFEIKYLYAPFENAQPVKATTSIDSYIVSIWDALFAEYMLSNNAINQDFDGDATRPIVEYRNTLFWGISVPWQVSERVAATMTP